MKVTMLDIANRLGVSKSLVSRALSDKYGVSDEMKTKIRLTAIEMGYKVPNYARNRRTGSAPYSISILLRRDIFTDTTFYNEILNGIESAVREKKMLLHLTIVEDNDTCAINTQNIYCDGIIVLGLMTIQNVAAVLTTGKAVVLLDTFNPSYKVDRISSNNFAGCYRSTDYMIACGHKHICFVGDINYSYSFINRWNGFRARVSESKKDGVVYSKAIGLLSDPDCPFCIDDLRSVLQQPDRPTALVCANDAVARYAYPVIKEMGLSIPHDISLIGFDNVRQSANLQPPLTTMNVPKYQMGHLAVEQLFERMAKRHDFIAYTQLDVELVERDSVLVLPK